MRIRLLIRRALCAALLAALMMGMSGCMTAIEILLRPLGTSQARGTEREQIIAYMNEKYDDTFTYYGEGGSNAILLESAKFPGEPFWVGCMTSQAGNMRISETYPRVKFLKQTQDLIMSALDDVIEADYYVISCGGGYQSVSPKFSNELTFEEYIADKESGIGFSIVIDGLIPYGEHTKQFEAKLTNAFAERNVCISGGYLKFVEKHDVYERYKADTTVIKVFDERECTIQSTTLYMNVTGRRVRWKYEKPARTGIGGFADREEPRPQETPQPRDASQYRGTAQQKIVAYMNDKYDDTFTYHGPFGGGTGDQMTQMLLNSAKFPEEPFWICCYRENGRLIVEDTYPRLKFMKQTRDLITSILDDVIEADYYMTDCGGGNRSVSERFSNELTFEEYVADKKAGISFSITIDGLLPYEHTDRFEADLLNAFAERNVCVSVGSIDFIEDHDLYEKYKADKYIPPYAACTVQSMILFMNADGTAGPSSWSYEGPQ